MGMNTRWSFALYCLNFGEQGGGLGLRSGTTFWGQSRIINSLLIKSTAFLHHVRVSGSKIYLEKPSVEFSLRIVCIALLGYRFTVLRTTP